MSKRKVLSAADFEKTTPAEMVGAYVTKEDFFKLTPLSEMTREGAAEQTYSQMKNSGRVIEEREVIEDPTGLTEDKVSLFVPVRCVNDYRRRSNVNRRRIEEHAKLFAQALPPEYRT